jgi:hypothetical protein
MSKHIPTQLQIEEARTLSPCNLRRKENIAIVLAYFSIGLVSSFITTPLNVYMVSVLNAEPQMQSTIGIIQTLPWSLKLIFGFLSDSCPIGGLHRKPYLTMGALAYSAAFISYAFMKADNVVLLGACVFFGTLGLIQVDVMADTMCVERSKFEPEATRGQMQASCYSVRFTGSLLGAILGASLTNKETWGWGMSFKQISLLNGLIPFILITPFLFDLREKYFFGLKYESDLANDKEWKSGDLELVDNKHNSEAAPLISVDKTVESDKRGNYSSLQGDSAASNEVVEVTMDEPPSIASQFHEIWQTVQLKAVWRPMAFVYCYNFLQVPNVAWQSYLQLSLHFEPWVLGLSVTLGSFMTLSGVLAYKYLFFKASWRKIYLWSTFLTSFFSLMQLVLIFQINKKYFHLNNYFFSLGDDVITAYISGIQFLPVCIMYMRLCPEGSEGASYAMLTTFGNIALVCASNLGNIMAGIWDVSNSAMRNHDVSGLWKLTVLTSLIEIVPLSLLWLLPHNPEEQEEVRRISRFYIFNIHKFIYPYLSIFNRRLTLFNLQLFT